MDFLLSSGVREKKIGIFSFPSERRHQRVTTLYGLKIVISPPSIFIRVEGFESVIFPLS